jgi:hypothetical protein
MKIHNISNNPPQFYASNLLNTASKFYNIFWEEEISINKVARFFKLFCHRTVSQLTFNLFLLWKATFIEYYQNRKS